MIDARELSPELLVKIIEKLPPGWARQQYEKILQEKNDIPLGEFYWEEQPAFYFLGEILALRCRTEDEVREIHKVKLTFPGVRLIQEEPEQMGFLP
ncbi:MAG: hypothetical protein ACREQA_01745 [Candidatus Binatia bacterium]